MQGTPTFLEILRIMLILISLIVLLFWRQNALLVMLRVCFLNWVSGNAYVKREMAGPMASGLPGILELSKFLVHNYIKVIYTSTLKLTTRNGG